MTIRTRITYQDGSKRRARRRACGSSRWTTFSGASEPGGARIRRGRSRVEGTTMSDFVSAHRVPGCPTGPFSRSPRWASSSSTRRPACSTSPRASSSSSARTRSMPRVSFGLPLAARRRGRRRRGGPARRPGRAPGAASARRRERHRRHHGDDRARRGPAGGGPAHLRHDAARDSRSFIPESSRAGARSAPSRSTGCGPSGSPGSFCWRSPLVLPAFPARRSPCAPSPTTSRRPW